MKLSPNLCPGATLEIETAYRPHVLTCHRCGRENLSVAFVRQDGKRFLSRVAAHRAKMTESGDIGDARYAAASDGVDWDYRWHGRQV